MYSKAHALRMRKIYQMDRNIKSSNDMIKQKEDEEKQNNITINNYIESKDIKKKEEIDEIKEIDEEIDEVKEIDEVNEIEEIEEIDKTPKIIKKEIPTTLIPLDKQKKKKMYLVITEGVCNRLQAIASAYSVSIETGRFLVVYWKKNLACKVLFSDIFSHPYTNMVVTDNIDFLQEDDVHVYNYTINERYIDDELDKDILIKSNTRLKNKYVLKKNELEFFKQLRPSFQIRTIIHDKYILGEKLLGLHIRNENMEEHVKKRYDKQKQWNKTIEAKKYHWRYKSHISRFISEINYHISLDPKVRFYVSTDTNENYKILEKLYGSRIITSYKDEYKNDTEKMTYALADLYLLSSCRTFIGSYHSSFTNMILNMHGTKNTRTSKDFIYDDNSKNILSENRSPGNSIITATMNKNKEIHKSLLSWLSIENCDEIIIIDWSSNIPISEQIHISDPRVIIYRVENQKEWNPSAAFNLAITLSTKHNIYKLGPTHAVIGNNMINNYPVKSNTFYSGLYSKDDDYGNQIHDAIFTTYKNLSTINFYNENIASEGWQDGDLYERLKEQKLSHKKIGIGYFSFNDKDKFKSRYGLEPKELRCLNKILSEKVFPKWDTNCKRNDYTITNKMIIMKRKYSIDLDNISKEILTESLKEMMLVSGII